MGVLNTLYHVILRKSSTYYLGAAVGVFAFERMLDVGCDGLFDYINQGKQWKDIKDKYAQ